MDVLVAAGLAVAGIVAVRRMRRTRSMERVMPGARFVEVTTVDELDGIFASNQGRPRVVFLDDPWCPISAAARRQVEQLDGEVLTVDVSRRSDLACWIASRTGIRHESPQAIVIDHGVAVWDASHWGISHGAITRAIDRLAHDGVSDVDEAVPDPVLGP